MKIILIPPILSLLILAAAPSCKSSSTNSTSTSPERYSSSERENIPQSVGVVITKLDGLLSQWNDAMGRPETQATLQLRRALQGEIQKFTIIRFDELRAELETSKTMRNREIIAAALGFSKKPEALNPLLAAAIQDPVPAVREKGLLGLSRLADLNTPVDLIASRLSADFTDGEQWNASLALQKLALAGAKMNDALPYMRSALASRNPTIRMHCAIGLGAAKDPAATPLLVLLLKDERALVAAAAANALGAIGDPSTAAQLIESMSSNEFAVRSEARKALARMNGGEDLGPEIGPWRRWLQHLELSKPAESRPAEPAIGAPLVK